MENNIDNLKRFIERIKSIGFFARIFSWGKIKNELVDAVTDLQKIISNSEFLNNTNQKLESQKSGLDKDLNISKVQIINDKNEIEKLRGKINILEPQNITLSNDISSAKSTIFGFEKSKLQWENDKRNFENRINQLENDNLELNTKVIQFETEEDRRKKQFENDIAGINKLREEIQYERSKEIEIANQEKIEYLKGLKETWYKHQDNVKGIIKNICQKQTVEYIEKVPFKLEPDNTIKICDEYIIFDAKSPASDDLSNFQSYLKLQAEAVKKYAKQENVKSDIFFVVPSNTLESLTQYIFNLADYNVFIISVDSLEQIILSLKKIEEYEFAEQLSPDERDNICRVLGRFAHLSKRRIQIDSFFAKQFIELAYKAESDLPKEIFEKVVEFERADKLNPPIEKRAKAISIKELEKDIIKINNEAFTKGIIIDDSKISDGINDLELYRHESE